MLEHLFQAFLIAAVTGLIKVIYDLGKSLTSVLADHQKRIAVLEIEVDTIQEDVREIRANMG